MEGTLKPGNTNIRNVVKIEILNEFGEFSKDEVERLVEIQYQDLQRDLDSGVVQVRNGALVIGPNDVSVISVEIDPENPQTLDIYNILKEYMDLWNEGMNLWHKYNPENRLFQINWPSEIEERFNLICNRREELFSLGMQFKGGAGGDIVYYAGYKLANEKKV